MATDRIKQSIEAPARPAPPCSMVIFGAAGDLTKRKLIPALYNLAVDGFLPHHFAVIGFGKGCRSDEKFRDQLSVEIREYVTGDFSEQHWDWLVKRLYFIEGDFANPEAYQSLQRNLEQLDRKYETGGNYLFYLAIPPGFFGEVIQQLGRAGLAQEAQGYWRRVIIEKPFGRDLESARDLNQQIQAVLKESQIYRIDHYLGKETVQNILVFRFSNGIFEPIWNRRYVDHVQITVSERLGVEQRGGYYEKAGALRDMVPNHLFQLLALTAMEPPNSFDADAVRDEKGKVLQAIQPITPEEVLNRTVRGQYGEGVLPDGEKVLGYRSEPGVAPDSNTETYAALKLMIDNWRWADVPFYLRTGKRLAERITEIVIQFKRAPFILFRDTPVEQLAPNRLVIRIAPTERIAVSFGAKIPGPKLRISEVDMDFCYATYFGRSPATGYETLLYDCMNGDATLFQRADNVESGWQILTPVLDVWKALPSRGFPNYQAGSSGPAEADNLLAREGRRWSELV